MYMNISRVHMNTAGVPPLFGTNMQLQNDFHLQLNSHFARILDWKRDVTVILNYGKRGGSLPG